MTHEFSAEVKGDYSALMKQMCDEELTVTIEYRNGDTVDVCTIKRIPSCPIKIYKAFLDSLV